MTPMIKNTRTFMVVSLLSVWIKFSYFWPSGFFSQLLSILVRQALHTNGQGPPGSRWACLHRTRHSAPLTLYIRSRAPGSSGHDGGPVWPGYFRLLGSGLLSVEDFLYNLPSSLCIQSKQTLNKSVRQGLPVTVMNQSSMCLLAYHGAHRAVQVRRNWRAGIFLRIHWYYDMGNKKQLIQRKIKSLRKYTKFWQRSELKI